MHDYKLIKGVVKRDSNERRILVQTKKCWGVRLCHRLLTVNKYFDVEMAL